MSDAARTLVDDNVVSGPWQWLGGTLRVDARCARQLIDEIDAEGFSRDPAFATKRADVVSLYIDPPAHAAVLSIDGKSQIQGLDRTQAGLPLKPGCCQTMTHDDKRHGTTTLFAQLSVLDGT